MKVKGSNKIRIVCYGIGVIGRSLANQLLNREEVEIVGAVDINKEIVGKDLGEVIGREKLGLFISDNTDNILINNKPDIVCHTTSSYLKNTFNEFKQLLSHGINVVSTCEELSYPYITKQDIEFAKELDKIAKENNVTILGTGINPGFIMDTLPICLTGVCENVEVINIIRQMNAANRRLPFQKKIGAGLSVDNFKEAVKEQKITGHVGLEQSIKIISDAFGWYLEEIIVTSVEPVILDHFVESSFIKVPIGYNAGSKQLAYGIKDGKKVITMDFRAYIGAPEEFDSIDIKGVPPINEKISPCIHGDHATIGMTVNMIPHVINAEAGLVTMIDLPIPRYTRNLIKALKRV